MNTIAPSLLYENPELRDQFDQEFQLHLPLERMLVTADLIVNEMDPVLFLDELHDTDLDSWFGVKQLLTNLPAKTIFDNYGEDMLAWAAANATFNSTAERLKEGLGELAGYDTAQFEKARLWMWQKKISSKGKEVLAQYHLMDAINSDLLDRVDLPTILENSTQEGLKLSQKRLDDYYLAPLNSEEAFTRPDGPAKGWYEEIDDVRYNIWLDAPVGIALMYKDKPNALVSIAMTNTDEAMIYQLQGVKAKRINPEAKFTDNYIVGSIGSRGLAPLDWQKVMVEATAEFARLNDFRGLAIQSGEHNKWTTTTIIGESEPHLSIDYAERAYDAPAERLGFAKGKDKNWHRSITR